MHLLPCPYKAITGIDCPGCGMQRAFIELLKGNLRASLHDYPALLPVLFTLLLTFAHLYFKFRKGASWVTGSFIITVGIVMTSYMLKLFFGGL